MEDSLDVRVGRLPRISRTAVSVTFELGILGGIMRTELFVPTPRTRLVLHCDRDGNIFASIREGRTSAA